MAALGIRSQGEMAEKLGISRSTLWTYTSGNTSPPSEVEDKLSDMEKANDLGSNQSVANAVPLKGGNFRVVPVISWAHAGEAESFEEIPAEWQESVPTDCRDPKAFALKIRGDSMEDLYRDGDVAIVMPSEEPRSQCLVIAKLASDGVIFRRLTSMESGLFQLSPYNQLYPKTEVNLGGMQWIYPVHSVLRVEWK